MTRHSGLDTDALTRVTFHIEPPGGRSCESCARSYRKRLLAVPGVEAVDTNFYTGIVRVSYDPHRLREDELERHVDAILGRIEHDHDDDEAEYTIPRDRLRIETAFVVVTFIGMSGGLIADWVDASVTVVWGLYALAYVFGGWYGLKASIQSLRHRTVDIDLLMILAAIGALIVDAPFEGAMLLFLFSLSNVLQHYAFGRSREAIRSLMQLRPESAVVLRDGDEVTVPIDEVVVGDHIVVRPGDRLPLDGEVVAGECTVDESTLTGESMPVAKTPGDQVFGGTIAEDGRLEVRVTRLAQESAIARLIHMVEEAQSEKAPTQRMIDRYEQPYVLGVFAITAIAIAIPLTLGFAFDSTFYRAMTIMVAASPCAVIISTPAAVLSAITAGARQGVLFKGGEHVENAAMTKVVAFDKTGTLTEGDTRLEAIGVRPDATIDGEELDEERLLALAAGVQDGSEHHLAEATVAAARQRSLSIPATTRFKAYVGKGVNATIDGKTLHIGNRTYVEDVLADLTIDGIESGEENLQQLESQGHTSVLVIAEFDDGASVLGWLGYRDTVRPGAAAMIRGLREHGVEHVVMLTGDTEVVARQIADEVGIDTVHAELLPEEKVDVIERLKDEYGTVAMVGDGVNDAPALATASIGIGMGGAGTDVTLETADIVLMADDLSKLPYVLGLSKETRRKLRVNLTIAFGAIAIMIVAIFTAGLPLPLAVVGHEGSTVLVSLNGLRLLLFRG